MKIVIVDYQMGNLRSVQKALEHVGASATVSSDPKVVEAADKVILPGVGAFGDAMSELKSRSLVEPICEFISQDKPFLGICLGLQMLLDSSDEGTGRGEESLPGMGVIAGDVRRFDFSAVPDSKDLKIPHMGWNRIEEVQTDCPLLAGIESDAHFYFVHSYYVAPSSADDVWLQADYGGKFCAAIWRGNAFATQFHPEKSQRDGLRMLQNFAEL
ncbi:MAG: imidazole glycerol phosphate synthase subunit HisH [Aureliella sp.]